MKKRAHSIEVVMNNVTDFWDGSSFFDTVNSPILPIYAPPPNNKWPVPYLLERKKRKSEITSLHPDPNLYFHVYRCS